MPQTIIALGYHDQSSPRHWSVCEAFRAERGDIIECHTDARGLLGKYRRLWKKYREIPGVRCQVSGVLVTFPGHYLAPLAWMLTRFPRKKLIFDAFISLYDTNVSDRKRVSRWHPHALFWYVVDFISCHLADEVLIDTKEHKKYFVKTFLLKPERIRVIYLASRPDLFFPKAGSGKREAGSSFNILFCGSYIPLHGIKHILRAAASLQDHSPHVHFTIIGSGQERPAMQALAERLHLRHVSFLPSVPLHRLPSLIHNADLCLGIFGTSPKVQRVIPHKVLDAVACGVPVITADTPAIRERFADHPLVIFCRAGDPDDLARAILARVSVS